VYKDNFKDNIKNYKEITGQVDGEGRNLSNNPETSGRYHTDWLNMMYPRLKLARNLLKDDGVIFISIDDTEVSNLRKISDEIFGEENFFADMVVIRAEGGGLAKRVVKGHDNLLVYAKDINKCKGIFKPKDIRGKIVEVEGREFWIEEDWLRREFGKYGTCLYEEIEEIKGTEKKKEIDKGLKDGIYRLIPKANGHIVGRLRALDEDGTKFYSILKHLNKTGIECLESLGLDKYFDFPKPISLLQELVLGPTIFTKTNAEIVLDFFSGSATTAHAVLRQNAEDGGNRKFIMVQLPETTDEKSEAYKAGYKTIAEISKERIRRAAAKIKEENPEYEGDLGFKVFKLDSTNIKPWEVDFDLTERTLEDFISNIKTDRREEDVLYEILLKYGLDLTLPITEHAIAGQKVFDIGMGALIICLSDAISLEVVEGIAMLKDDLNPEIMRVVFKDSGFKDDVVKTNAVQILKQAGIVDVRSL
jgi:adenine-specific DNA-methyltransferase